MIPLVSDVAAQIFTVVRIHCDGKGAVLPAERAVGVAFEPGVGSEALHLTVEDGQGELGWDPYEQVNVVPPATELLDVRIEIMGLDLEKPGECSSICRRSDQMFSVLRGEDEVKKEPVIRVLLFHVR